MFDPVFQTTRRLLSQYLPQTRLVTAQSLTKSQEQSVYLKLENEMPTGSFKVRGAIYALQVNEKRMITREVVASSTGNHGAAVAYAARLLGWKARIFLPEKNNPVKRKNIERLGAVIEEKGAIDGAGAFEGASAYARKSGAFFLNDASDPDLPAGPATIACEIFEQQPKVDTIYIPMGDTALIRGVADAAKQISRGVKIIGVQSERAPSYFLSWKEGRAIETETCDTIADGLATRMPMLANVQSIRQLVDEVVLVSEQEMLQAIGRLLIDEHVIAEPAGAAAAAAYLKTSYGNRGNVALLVTGANASPSVLRQAIATYDGDLRP
ncbi:MAG TPA: pyridoxal-phosphate dependent enzyme [Candidatus Bathyarchaeia archaeon]|nr:pyridoxal-phosphate dependent enzyme [Candidatus Bathyarchaeia archaeon]